MLRRFLHNTAISAVAYGLAGLLGLLALGLITRSYGLEALGLIVLARSFLPTGLLSLVDFGVSEVTTQAVARGSVGDWTVASEKVSLLAMIAAVTGIVSGVVLWSLGAKLAVAFKVDHEHSQAFISVLQVTALVLPITFAGLVAEGALKGFEEYAWLRLTEVASSALYVVSIYVAIWQRIPWEWIAYSYLATIVAKYLVLAIIIYISALGTPLRFSSWSTASRDDVLQRCWLIFNSRIAGMLQHTLPPLAVGLLFSPTEVGMYDLITRLPRFLKAVMAPLYSAILPISTHIEEKTDTRRLQILGRNGLVFPAAIVFPILITIGLFSRQILSVWVGPQHADQWPWLALSLLVPAVTIQLGAGQSALMVRSGFLRFNTKVLYLQVLAQYVITLVALARLREDAFILGWAISHVAFAPILAHHLLAQLSLPISLFWLQLFRHLMVGAILVVLVAILKLFLPLNSLLELVLVGGFTCVIALALSAALVLTATERTMLVQFGRAIIRRQ
ncbi:lipopolysaccharide biosynthesis protein [Bradyrhizobium cenepequi]